MSDTTIWMIMAALLVGAELLTGTLYLLMLAIGAASGAALAAFGVATETQLVGAAIVGGATVGLWHLRQRRRAPMPNEAEQLDVGEVVQVANWQADGTTRVMYRGATWQARISAAEQAHPLTAGAHRITAIEGNHLVLSQV